MAALKFSAFSEDASYFVCSSADGKLKIWHTLTGLLKREITPSAHLKAPCTCLTWLTTARSSLTETPGKWTKRKRKSVIKDSQDVIAFGTTQGKVFLYSLATGGVVAGFESGHTQTVNSLTWNKHSNLFSCSDDKSIVEWDINNSTVKRKWKTFKQRPKCLLVLPNGESLLSAGKTIDWWDLKETKVIKTFRGHSKEVIGLTHVPSPGGSYFISHSEGDKFISAWSLVSNTDQVDSVASFVTEEAVTNVCVWNESGEPTYTAAVTQGGSLHVFRHQLNGKCTAPLKPTVTFKIAASSQDGRKEVQSIAICAAFMHSNKSILLAHGSWLYLTFETITPAYDEDLVCLVRRDPTLIAVSKEGAKSKVKTPRERKDAVYSSAAASVSKRSRDKGEDDLPMEERLETLMLHAKGSERPQVPESDNLAQLLIQGLHSKDKNILEFILTRNDPNIIKNTVESLPVQVIAPFLRELTERVQRKVNPVIVLWLKELVSAHASQLLATPEVAQVLTPLLTVIKARLSTLVPLLRLRGRLDLLIDQAKALNTRNRCIGKVPESLVVIDDNDTSDEEESDAAGQDSEELEDEQWTEQSEAEGRSSPTNVDMDVADEDGEVDWNGIEEDDEMSS